MFNLIAVRDTVPIAPKTFGIDPAITIRDALNKKYANRLIPDRGLALSVYDILTVEDGRVTWGNGQMYYKVSFRLMMFYPFVGEVIVGRIISSSPFYIRVSLEFFQDVYINRNLLPPNSAYDPDIGRFFWVPDFDEALAAADPAQLFNSIKSDRLYLDDGEPIRFRVDSVHWTEHEPLPPSKRAPPPALNTEANGGAEVNGASGKGEAEIDPYERAGFKILGAIAESGLGIVSWWDQEDVEEEQEGVDE